MQKSLLGGLGALWRCKEGLTAYGSALSFFRSVASVIRTPKPRRFGRAWGMLLLQIPDLVNLIPNQPEARFEAKKAQGDYLVPQWAIDRKQPPGGEKVTCCNQIDSSFGNRYTLNLRAIGRLLRGLATCRVRP